MVIIDYKKQYHARIIKACVLALEQGKVVAYPTDTCYGLGADSENAKAVRKIYKVKGRSFRKPIHLIPSSLTYAKRIAEWNPVALKLAKSFWPGPLTIVSSIKYQVLRKKSFKVLSAGTKTLGLRMPDNKIALDLAKYLKSPITTTSANVSGQKDNYSVDGILSQFKNKKFKPDIIINAGKLPMRKPSTLIKIDQNKPIQILRTGPISPEQIKKALSTKH